MLEMDCLEILDDGTAKLCVHYEDDVPVFRTIWEALKGLDVNRNWLIEYWKLLATGKPIAELKVDHVDAKLLPVASQWIWVRSDNDQPPPKTRKRDKF